LNSESLDEAFGIRDIRFYFTQKTITSHICGIENGFSLHNQEVCKCPSGQYEVSSNNCVNCDDACLSCFGGNSSSCYRCSDGYYFNGTDCTNCDTFCAICDGPDSSDCITCAPGYILYNQTCVFCPSGIIFEGSCIDANRCTGFFIPDSSTNFCISPCDGEPRTTWNESCFPPCLGSDIPDLGLTCKGKMFLIF